MSKITCKLLSHSNHRHLPQIYTGFFMLYKRGLIKLAQEIIKEKLHDPSLPPHLRDARLTHLRVILNNTLKLCYDTHDSWEIDEEYLNWADFYFKRSLSLLHKEKLEKHGQKIYPLGLNYLVYPDSADKFALQRSITLTNNKQDAFLTFVSSLNPPNIRGFIPKVNIMEALPDMDAPPKILFMARAWDPYDNPERRDDKVAERIRLNDMRANCIKLLRDEFGSAFFGGFIHSDFAKKHYSNLLLQDNTRSLKWNYINLLRSFPICVATTGLNGSIGYKFAEYVAFSKAILSERLNYSVPGDLKEEVNYLGFNTPEECVEHAARLLSDRELRNYLMLNNARYYQSYLRPDSLILNTLLIALSKNQSFTQDTPG